MEISGEAQSRQSNAASADCTDLLSVRVLVIPVSMSRLESGVVKKVFLRRLGSGAPFAIARKLGDCVRERLGRLLRQIVTGAGNLAMAARAGKSGCR